MKMKGEIFNYRQYQYWVQALVKTGKTSGEKQNPALIAFTVLNQKRMERLNKTIQIDNRILDAIVSMQGRQIWYVIAEPWCGDCAQILPVIAKIAGYSNGWIDLRIILRDENPDWTDKYHTNGSKAIPKLISFNNFGKELFRWGARPKEAQELLMAWKQNPNGKSWDDFEKDLHTWYAKDKTKSVQNEFFQILSISNKINTGESADYFCNN